MNLKRLLQTHLWPYRRLLYLVVALQAVQTYATLTLPQLSADLINHGVLTGDNGYIWRTGGIMAIDGDTWIQAVRPGDVVRVGPMPAKSSIVAVRRFVP